MVFAHQDRFRIASSHVQKILENDALGPPKPFPDLAKTFENRARSGPKREKNDQETPRTQQDAKNVPKKRPRAKKEANMAPT